MPRILKIYNFDHLPPGREQAVKVLEKYPAFTLAEVADDDAGEIGREYLTEDITDQYTLPGGIDTSVPRISASGKTLPHPAYKSRGRLPPGPHHYIVQFIGPIRRTWLARARKAGADFVEPYEGFSYIARLTPESLETVSKLPFVRWLGHLPYDARLSAQAIAGAGRDATQPDPKVPRTKIRSGVYTVQFFKPEQAAKAVRPVRELGFEILENRSDAGFLIIETARAARTSLLKQLDQLSRVHGVSQVTERPLRRKSNDRAAVIMGTAASLGNPGLGLSGKDEIIAVADTGIDTGDVNNMHPDFAGRILFIKSYPITHDFNSRVLNRLHDDGPADLDSGHGTHTTGSVLGNGTAASNLPGLAGPIRGLSYKAQLVFQAVEQEMKWRAKADFKLYGRFALSGIPTNLETLFADAYAKGARIHSNSWGGGNPGEYDEQCRQLDEFVWKKPDFCILFAAGNDGRDGDADGVIDLGSVTSPGTAKNCVTVGASENNRPEFTLIYGQEKWAKDYPAEPIKSDRVADNPDDIVAFSSRGPTLDGRIKPDVIAPGTFILSTRSRMIAENNFAWGPFGPSNQYMFDGGTSMSTPLTAGAVGVVREYLRTRQAIAAPSAALLKATLIAGATYLRGPAGDFDNHQGFGRVNLDAILNPQAPATVLFLDRPGINTGDMDDRAIGVTSAAAPLRIVLAYSDFPGPRLVNNLNLIVRAPDGTVSVGNSRAIGAHDFDTGNNVELVHLGQPALGTYRIQVVASNVPQGPQPFALVVSGAVTPQA
jgi:serine protease AprX